MNYKICTGDISNAYLFAKAKEKVYIIPGKEFEELEGRILITDRSLYGLRQSGYAFPEHLANKLRSIQFKPSKSDGDFWIRDRGDHYEYIGTYVDDIMVFSKEPLSVIKEIEST